MHAFKTYHPIVNFIYFVCVIGFSMFFMHPICLGISLLCGFGYSVILKGKKAFTTNVLYMLPIMLITALINPIFNHEGITILAYLPSGNPLTLESILYGLSSAVMLCSVICWFSCYNIVMTSDKFIYLFGRIIPSLSLIFSMTLRFVPRFLAQCKVVTHAQKCIGQDVTNGSIFQRAKHGLSILSIMITWALENSIDTADSMKSRGYGLPGRTAFSIFTFAKRDKKVFGCVVALGIYVLVGGLFGGMDFGYFPKISGGHVSIWGASIHIAYFALCMLPMSIEFWEVRKWKAIQSKI